MATNENTDDTILDDELDENEFTFDNENEDALLAETEYDFVEKRTCTDLKSADHLEAEEDVLDIGIAEEDIVEAESTTLTQSTSLIIPNDQIILAKETICETQFISNDFNAEEKEPSNGIDIRKDESNATVENREYSEAKTAKTSDSLEFDEKDTICSSVDEIETNESDAPKKSDSASEKCVKSTVISLRKFAGKNYDNLPALAKVIEKVQPAVSSSPTSQPFRNRKLHSREYENDYRDNGSRKRFETASYKRRYDHDDSRRRPERRRYTSSTSDNSSDLLNGDSSRHHVELDNPEWISNSEDSASQKYDTYALESTLESNMTRQVIDERTRYENTCTGFSHQSFVASVQITQERYHITSDLSVPVSDGSFNRPFCDFGSNAAVSLPPPPGIRPIGSSQPLLQPPRPGGPPFMGNNVLARSPLGPPGYRNPTAAPFFRSMPPPLTPLSQPAALSSPVMNRPPLNMSGAPLIYPNSNPNFPSPHLQLPFSGPSHQMRQPPPPCVSQHPNRPPFPPPAPNHPHPQLRPAPMTPLHAPPGTGHPPPPSNFGPPQMVPMRCPPPFRQFGPAPALAPAQQLQRPPRMAPVYAPRMTPQPSAPASFVNSNPMTPHAGPFPPHGVNSTASLGPSNRPSPAYQQPPPPGVHSNLHLPPPPMYQSSANEVNYSHYGSNNQQILQQQKQQQQQVQHQSRSFYPNSEQLPRRMADCSVVQKETNANNLKRLNVESTDERGSYKQTRYDYPPASPTSKKDEDEEMMLYREKVEHQKKLREKFVQMKEEQRLKNQMQSFIQNNIKGILEKREQFLRKSDDGVRCKSDGNSRTSGSHNADSGSSTGRTHGEADAAHRRAERSARLEKVVERADRSSSSSSSSTSLKRVAEFKCRPTTTSSSGESEMAEKTRRNSPLEVAAVASNKSGSSDHRQLHKVIKIKYKDGTVAFKSIPVHSSDGEAVIGKHESNVRGGSDGAKSLVSVDEDGERRGAVQRRMVVSKRIPVANVKNDTSNENAIVESIRKGVTQSSVPLAQRFSSLRATNKPLNARPL